MKRQFNNESDMNSWIKTNTSPYLNTYNILRPAQFMVKQVIKEEASLWTVFFDYAPAQHSSNDTQVL